MNAAIMKKTQNIYYPIKNDVLKVKSEIIQIPTVKTPYIYIENANETESIEEYIGILKHLHMNTEIIKRISEYENEIEELLKIYDNGKNNSIFKDNNLELYFKMQQQFSNIIDLRYDISENKIETINREAIIDILDMIIKMNRNIIEDINDILI